jgi:hypothetical protein
MDEKWNSETFAEFEAPSADKIDTLLRKLGLDEATVGRVRRRIQDVDVQQLFGRLRTYAKENPAVVWGALCAVAVGGAAVAAERTVNKRSRRAKARSSSSKKTSSKRTLIEPTKGDKRFVRRDARGRIKESVDAGRSLSADRKRQSKTRSKRGQGDRGDR